MASVRLAPAVVAGLESLACALDEISAEVFAGVLPAAVGARALSAFHDALAEALGSPLLADDVMALLDAPVGRPSVASALAAL